MRIKKINLLMPIMIGTCVLGVVLTGCHSSNDVGNQLSSKDIQGLWEQNGYGRLLHINGDKAEVFEFTRASCLQTGELDSEELDELIETVTLSDDKTSFEKKVPSELFSESFQKRTTLPDFCEPNKIITESTPSIVFNHIWHSFNDYYAFFSERSVDWEAQGARYQSQVSDDMSDEQLFTVLAEMLDPLDDDHVELRAETEELEADFSPAHDAFVFENELAKAFEQQSEFDDVDEYTQFYISEARKLPLKSITNIKQSGLEIEIGDNKVPAIYWGTTNNNIAYINITRMFLFDESIDLEDEDFEYHAEKDMQALNIILNKIMTELKDTQGMIIDVRLNSGGSDYASLEITNQFVSDRLLVISKFARSFNGNTPVKHIYTTPVSNPYLSPVVILSSQETGSAAEIFLMAMNALPNVTLMGEASNGRLSEILEKTLPNDWEFDMSNEVYSDYLDRRFEVSGVPVDVEVKALSLTDIEQNTDSALEKALNSLN